MKPFNVMIAFGNKLQAIREQDGGLEEFNPDEDEEFQLLVATTQYCFTVLENHGVVIPLAAFDLSMEELTDKIDSLVEKYQYSPEPKKEMTREEVIEQVSRKIIGKYYGWDK